MKNRENIGNTKPNTKRYQAHTKPKCFGLVCMFAVRASFARVFSEDTKDTKAKRPIHYIYNINILKTFFSVLFTLLPLVSLVSIGKKGLKPP